MKTWQDLKVGDTVWLYVSDWRMRPGAFDASVLKNPVTQDAFRMNERNAWAPRKIDSETAASWVIAGAKYSKKKRPDHLEKPLVLISEQEVDDAAFVARNYIQVARSVERVTRGPGGADALRNIVRELQAIGVEVPLR